MTRAWMPDAKPRRDEETQLQIAVIAHLRLLAPKNVLYWHVPNGMLRSKRTAGRLKAMGVRPGVFDLNFILADGRFAAMELKSPTGRLSRDQIQFQDACVALGIECAVCSGIDSALSILTAWGVLPNTGRRASPQILP